MPTHVTPFRAILVVGTVLAAACADVPTAPAPNDAPAAARAVHFWEANAATAWNFEATQLAAATAVDANRMYAYLSMAQYRAAEAAEASGGPHPPTAAAIGSASAVVLSAFFPASAGAIEARLDAQEAAAPWPGAKHQDFSAGEAIGRAIGAAVVAYAAGDRAGLTDPGTPPIGPGYWVWNGGPIVRGLLGARPFFLAATDELRPPPPPAFGSAEFLAALAEVKALANNRTAEQLASALDWHLNQSPRSNATMNGLARELIATYRVKDTEAARILFLANAAIFDALIGCFDAKYAYWYIRPSQADAGINTAFAPPPHPSYPSAHACVSGAITSVLAAAFPSERARVEALAIEAGMSRVYAGIHYVFDSLTGLALGQAAGAKALGADLDEEATLP